MALTIEVIKIYSETLKAVPAIRIFFVPSEKLIENKEILMLKNVITEKLKT